MSAEQASLQLAKALSNRDGHGAPKPSVAAAALQAQEQAAVLPFSVSLTDRPPCQKANRPHARSRPSYADERARAFEFIPPGR